MINMKFEANLKELRKQRGMSQEEMAEHLQVSRQSVSKWENGSAMPELDKLLQMCELFHCTLDDLLKGDMKEEPLISKAEYEKQTRMEAVLTTIGVGMILLGMTMYNFLDNAQHAQEESVLDAMFLTFVLIGVICFVFMGMKKSFFDRRHPQIPQGLYGEEEIASFERKFTIAICLGVGLILFGMIAQQLLDANEDESFANGTFMLLVTFAVCIFVYFGMHKGKMDQTLPQSADHKKQKQQEETFGLYAGMIMLVATGGYLILSFLFDAWAKAWILFPIGGILCGILHLFMKSRHHSDDE